MPVHVVSDVLLRMGERLDSINQSDGDGYGDEQCINMVEDLDKRIEMVDQTIPDHEESVAF